MLFRSELFNAWKFLGALNKKITKGYLSSLRKIEIEEIIYGNSILIVMWFMKINKPVIKQPLPLLTTKTYASHLLNIAVLKHPKPYQRGSLFSV